MTKTPPLPDEPTEPTESTEPASSAGADSSVPNEPSQSATAPDTGYQQAVTPPPYPGEQPYGDQRQYPPPSWGYSNPPAAHYPSGAEQFPYARYTPISGYPTNAYYVPPKHPQAQTSLILGIVGLVGTMCCCLFFLPPIAWVLGGGAVKEIDADPQRYSGRDEARVGKILGIVGTIAAIFMLIYTFGMTVWEVQNGTF